MAHKRKFYSRMDRVTPDMRARTDQGIEAYCTKARKRKYTSKGQAIRAGSERYTITADAYRCRFCNTWHCTRRDTPLEDPAEPSADEAATMLVRALGIGDDEA